MQHGHILTQVLDPGRLALKELLKHLILKKKVHRRQRLEKLPSMQRVKLIIPRKPFVEETT